MDVNKHINYLKRRGFLMENTTINFEDFCKRGSQVFCRITNELMKTYEVTSNPELYDTLVNSVTNIYNTLKPSLNDNKSRFTRLVELVLDEKPDNSINTLKIISDEINNVHLGKLRDGIDALIKQNTELSDDEMRSLINNVKFQSYTEYENSFTLTDHFSKYKTNTSIMSKEVSSKFIDDILKITNGTKTFTDTVNEYYKEIETYLTSGEFIKSDIKCKKDLVDTNGVVVIKNGEFVEVKKMDYNIDSYLSEFLSVYKQEGRTLPEEFSNEGTLKMYNKFIDRLCTKLYNKGNELLRNIKFAGIMFENNLYIKRGDIDLYWSNRGQRLKDHRLTIRFRVKHDNIPAWFYVPNEDVMVEAPLKNITITKQDQKWIGKKPSKMVK